MRYAFESKRILSVKFEYFHAFICKSYTGRSIFFKSIYIFSIHKYIFFYLFTISYAIFVVNSMYAMLASGIYLNVYFTSKHLMSLLVLSMMTLCHVNKHSIHTHST